MRAHSLTHPDGWDEVWESVSEVGVVSEHMLGEKRRDGVATHSCIEHKDQNTDVYSHAVKNQIND